MRWMPVCAGVVASTALLQGQTLPDVQNALGVRLVVAEEDTQPALDVVLPDGPGVVMKVVFPEHITVRKRGGTEGEQLYLYRPGKSGERPAWRTVGGSLEYESDLKGNVHLLARATQEEDGVLFHYELQNRSNVDYEMALAITDPRMISTLHDERLERTYVHHRDGFDLLASETPERLTLPLNQWLPSRYLASYTWPVPALRVEKRTDGITYYNKSRAVDEPMIATVSTDGKWVAASFTKTTGNVWSNPELTCQHVDPAKPLSAGGSAVLEVKILIFKGTLEDALRKVRAQRSSLQ
ncbi:hypothetical protein EDE15_3369 [Edaphobacter aggregans]|uniref:Uncharacterized protein n=1 Tax=Edaphobacter aggregans TaxID=570835 RepID=A0A3R9R4M7_9BACT|nr:hypothetical protein [Edaphobacter aggregans]RSL17820.1 hypothetical protein EDE15_3369 [Edaphobacter aggregans]